MKMTPDRYDASNAITRHEPGCVWVLGTPWRRSVLVPWQGESLAWGVERFDDLSADHFARLLALAPELVVFGSGARLRFVAPALLRALIERGIGVETMDTPAACRTFNVLSGEGRRVAAALLVEPAA